MAYLSKNRAISESMFMYYFIYLLIHAYPTTESSVIPYRFNNTFYLGRSGLRLQVSKLARCEKIKIAICNKNDVGYVDTFLPNIFDERTQYQAGLSLKTFHLLLDINCSLYLRRFLCSLYLPICSFPFRKELILPCRHFCVMVRNDCSQVLEKFGLPWPAELNCKKFPKSGLCVGPPLDTMKDNSTIRTIIDSFPRKVLIPYKKKQETKTLIVSPILRINGLQKIEGCKRICVNINYNIVWMKVYFILCLLSTFCTVYIFFSDKKRYLYPERALVWMAGSYMVMSLAYMVEYFTKMRMEPILTRINNNYSSVKLTETWYFSKNNTIHWQNLSNISSYGNVLSEIQPKNTDYGCIFYFVIQNISMMAGCLWWTMASIASFLFISHSRDFVTAMSPLFHLTVWCVSSFFSIILILEFAHPVENDFCSLSTFLNTLFRLCCLFFFLLFKLKEWMHTRNTELRITRKLDRKMRFFSEICTFAFFLVVLCQLLELLEKDPPDNCSYKSCFYANYTWNNIMKVKYFIIFFPGIASVFCMSFKRKMQCQSDDDDNEEINL